MKKNKTIRTIRFTLLLLIFVTFISLPVQSLKILNGEYEIEEKMDIYPQ